MRELVARYLSRSISRRSFLKGLTTAGISLAAAESVLESLVPAARAQGTDGIKLVEGTGAECFAEQLIASGVRYVFGNSASEIPVVVNPFRKLRREIEPDRYRATSSLIAASLRTPCRDSPPSP